MLADVVVVKSEAVGERLSVVLLVLAVHDGDFPLEVHRSDVLQVLQVLRTVVSVGLRVQLRDEVVHGGVKPDGGIIAYRDKVVESEAVLFLFLLDLLIASVVVRQVSLDHHSFPDVADGEGGEIRALFRVIRHFADGDHDKYDSHYQHHDSGHCGSYSSHWLPPVI